MKVLERPQPTRLKPGSRFVGKQLRCDNSKCYALFELEVGDEVEHTAYDIDGKGAFHTRCPDCGRMLTVFNEITGS